MEREREGGGCPGPDQVSRLAQLLSATSGLVRGDQQCIRSWEVLHPTRVTSGVVSRVRCLTSHGKVTSIVLAVFLFLFVIVWVVFMDVPAG